MNFTSDCDALSSHDHVLVSVNRSIYLIESKMNRKDALGIKF